MQSLDTHSSDNGVAAPAVPRRFSEWSLRRLARLHAQAAGTQEIANVVSQATHAAQARFQEALAEACDEIGVSMPPGQAQFQIDWRTGEFSFEQPSP